MVHVLQTFINRMLVKKSLVCWNMLHRVVLMWQIESLKQNGLSLCGSLQWHFQLIQMRLLELFTSPANAWTFLIIVLNYVQSIFKLSLCIYKRLFCITLSASIGTIYKWSLSIAHGSRTYCCVVQNPCLENFCNNYLNAFSFSQSLCLKWGYCLKLVHCLISTENSKADLVLPWELMTKYAACAENHSPAYWSTSRFYVKY